MSAPADDMANWIWLIAGALIGAAEALAPGVFLIWIGVAAFSTGLIGFVAPLQFESSLLVFAALAVVAVLLGRRLYGSAATIGDRPFLNRRAEALVGRIVVLNQAIAVGEGRARVDDTIWRVAGPDLPAGARVRIIGVKDASVLLVEPASEGPEA